MRSEDLGRQGLSHRVAGAVPGRCFCLMTLTPSEDPKILAGAETEHWRRDRSGATRPGGPPGSNAHPSFGMRCWGTHLRLVV